MQPAKFDQDLPERGDFEGIISSQVFSDAEKFQLLSAYLDDEVSEHERHLVAHWLASDAKLKNYYQSQQQLRQAIRSAGESLFSAEAPSDMQKTAAEKMGLSPEQSGSHLDAHGFVRQGHGLGYSSARPLTEPPLPTQTRSPQQRRSAAKLCCITAQRDTSWQEKQSTHSLIVIGILITTLTTILIGGQGRQNSTFDLRQVKAFGQYALQGQLFQKQMP
ncbi:MAG: hypothetical protein AAFO06_08415 [Cyanobacteria bacterium J06597_16]